MESALGRYRVLDLMEKGSGLCTKLLADWGAEVIKIEPPGGSTIRSIGPFYHDCPHPEGSLFWLAFNSGKKSVTLNIETVQGQQMIRWLARSAHFVVESFPPGYLDGLGLGYSSLSQVNPGLIMTSITPFGQTGPYSRYVGHELVTEAMGGILYNLGTPDRSPVRPMSCRAGSIACLVAEIQASGGSLIANYHRCASGEGQHVDVSIQECISNVLQQPPIYWDTNRILVKRVGGGLPRTARGVTSVRRAVFACKDGYAQALLIGEWFEPMVEWMDSEGAAGDLKSNIEWWRKRMAMDADPPLSQEEVNHIEQVLGAFLAGHTKAGIYQAAEARGIGWSGICSVGEMTSNEQLRARDFFVELSYPDLPEALRFPGPPFKATGTPPRVASRAPSIGEHNDDIYIKELGLSRDDMILLRQSGVI